MAFFFTDRNDLVEEVRIIAYVCRRVRFYARTDANFAPRILMGALCVRVMTPLPPSTPPPIEIEKILARTRRKRMKEGRAKLRVENTRLHTQKRARARVGSLFVFVCLAVFFLG